MFVKQNNELKNTKMQMLGSKAYETFILHKNRFIAKYAQENRMNIGHCKRCFQVKHLRSDFSHLCFF